VTQLDKVTQQNAAMVEQATASSHALNSEAGKLGDLVARFRLDHASGRSGSAQPRPTENVMVFQSPRRQQSAADAKPAMRLTPATMVAAGGRNAVPKVDGWEDF
jgi:methyl-accepting chemotaxis protein